MRRFPPPSLDPPLAMTFSSSSFVVVKIFPVAHFVVCNYHVFVIEKLISCTAFCITGTPCIFVRSAKFKNSRNRLIHFFVKTENTKLVVRVLFWTVVLKMRIYLEVTVLFFKVNNSKLKQNFTSTTKIFKNFF